MIIVARSYCLISFFIGEAFAEITQRSLSERFRSITMNAGGNPHGIPVHIIGLEKDDRGVSSGGSLFFAETTGLEVVLDDSNHVALHQFFFTQPG